MIRRLAERRFERKAARRYLHMTPYRECGVGFFCWVCAWRTVIGADRRALTRLVARMNEVRASGELPTIRREVTDEMREWVFEGRMTHALSLHGQVECPRPHHTLYWPGSRCHCGAQV